MTLVKLLAMGSTGLLGLVLTTALPPLDEPHAPPARKKDAGGPGSDLTKAYTLLRRLRVDGRTTGRPEDRLKDWTERATRFYRAAVDAADKGEERKAREYGTAAHDLARAVDHARNAATSEPVDDLPPPPDRDSNDDQARRDLNHAHDRIIDLKGAEAPDSEFYFKAAKDLYHAARRDAQAGRIERAGELARAAEALTHVPEHLARAEREAPEPREKKAKKDRPEPKEKKDRPEPPKAKRDRPETSERIPPPID